MSDPDLATAVIEMRRLLPDLASSVARLGAQPEDGIRLTLPVDNQYWLTLKVVAGTATESEISWELARVAARGAHLPDQVTVLATGSQEQMLADVDNHYRRLMIERRNAACGTPRA